MSFLRRLLVLVTLAAIFSPAPGLAWPHGQLGQLVLAGSLVPMTVPDASGGAWVGYCVYGGAVSNYDLFVQHYDRDGNALLGPNGLLICNATDIQQMQAIGSDGAGGAVLVWSDYRAGGFTQADFYAQRVIAAGSLAWTANGVVVTAATGAQTQLRMVTNASGAWFAWADGRNSPATGNDIYAQYLNMASGTPTMIVNGALVCDAPGDQNAPDLAVDENNSCRIAWADYRTGVADIYAQRIATSGTTSWLANGLAVCTAAGAQRDVRIRQAGGSKFYVAWSDNRTDYDVYAQLIDGFSGAANWAANGVAVSATTGFQILMDVTVDTNGMLVAAWTDTRRGGQLQDAYVQKLDLSGAAQWTVNGVPVRFGSGVISNIDLVSNAAGGVYVVWDDARSDVGDVFAQRVSPLGAMLWTANGVPLATGDNQQGFPTGALNPEGGFFCVWSDYRSGGTGSRVQLVDEWGDTGANPIMAGVKDVPNDQGGQVKVSWYASALDTDPLYRNISDYILFRSVPPALAAQVARAGASGEGGVTVAGKRYIRTRYAAQDYFWEELAHVIPRHLAQYSYVAPTEGDSIAGSNRRTVFMVMALASNGEGWWTTKADSGYSVDNIPPAAPAPLTGQYAFSGTTLHWNRNAEPDLAGYRVYRGSSASFVPSPASLLTTVADTGYVASGAVPYFYKLSAIDTHGNESPVATLLPSGTAGVDDVGLRVEFAPPSPNPMRGGHGASLRFALAASGPTRLAVYDAQGRLVRVLSDGARAAGAHAIEFDGRDGGGRTLAPGLYLARLSAPGLSVTRRLVVIE